MEKSITKMLEESGFSQKEAIVYLSLLEIGKGDVTDIAQRGKLKRSIVYVTLDNLERQGYVSKVPGTKVQNFVAVDPVKILHHLQNTAGNFEDILPIMRSFQSKGANKPRINFFEGEEGVLSVYKEINMYEEVYFVTSIERLIGYFPDEVKRWIDGIRKQTIKFKAKILLQTTAQDISFASKVVGYDQKIKFLNKDTKIEMDFSLFGNKIAITSLSDPLFVVVVESEALYNSMKSIFNLIWQSGSEINTNHAQFNDNVGTLFGVN